GIDLGATSVQSFGSVTLNSNAGVAGGSATISASGLRVLGSGSFDLSHNTNSISTLAGNLGTGSSLNYVNTSSAGFSIGTITSSPNGGIETSSTGLTVGA